MTIRPPNLAQAPWLESEPVRRVFAALAAEGDEARVVGGAVRNALTGVPVADVDFATTATPEAVARLAAAAHIKTVPTGVEHGTLTLVVEGQPFEVTTLREDVATDGRRATVRFGNDWTADARRRDFTVNALSVDANGVVHDPLEGYGDVVAGRIRFIGNPDKRIAEDRLRILRFFRFNAEHGRGAVDPVGLAAAIRAREGLRELSAERIAQEMRRLLAVPRAAEMAQLMQDVGVLPIVLGGVGYVGALAGVMALEAAAGTEPSPPLRLVALAARIEEDVLRVATRLRLSNAERDRMLAAVAAARVLQARTTIRAARVALYRHGRSAYEDGVTLAAAWSDAGGTDWRELRALPEQWTPPAFPLNGRDVLGHGVEASPMVGAVLRDVERWWISEDFQPDEAALRRRLQQAMAAQQ